MGVAEKRHKVKKEWHASAIFCTIDTSSVKLNYQNKNKVTLMPKIFVFCWGVKMKCHRKMYVCWLLNNWGRFMQHCFLVLQFLASCSVGEVPFLLLKCPIDTYRLTCKHRCKFYILHLGGKYWNIWLNISMKISLCGLLHEY